MPQRLVRTRRGNAYILAVATAILTVLAIAIDDTRTAVMTMIALTAIEATVFVVVAFFRANWRDSEPMRAVLGFQFTYAVMAIHTFTLYLTPRRWWWSDDLRGLIFAALVIAGLYLSLTVWRLVHQ